MAEELLISKSNKESAYQTLLPQLKALIEGESNLYANLANISSALKMTFNHLWTGFYLVEGKQLVLGPFQGPIACTRIPKGKGVCGTAWEQKQTIIVKDVNQFPGHIACSSESVSEIVTPIIAANGDVMGIIDIDSITEGTFDTIDQKYLEQIAQIITQSIA